MRAAWPWGLALCGGSLLAVWGTWPLAAHLSAQVYDPTGLPGVLANAVLWDIHLTLWILAWDTHALVTSPGALFDANVFYPARWTLAGCEHMLGALPLYLPVAAISRDPVVAHQVTLLLTFVCAFVAAVALVRDWSRSWPAAVTAGTLFAFSRFRMSNLGALEVEGNYFLPLIPLAAYRASTGTGWWSVVLAGALVLQSLHSYYLGYAAFLGAASLTAVTLAFGRMERRQWRRVVVPIGAAALVVAISTVPYLRAGRATATSSPLIVEVGSAVAGGTGATAAAVLAGLTAPWWRRGTRSPIGSGWIAALVVIAVLGHAVAVGPTVLVLGHRLPGPYRFFASFVPGFALVRTPVRFNALATMALAALAGLGVAGVLGSLATRPRVRAIAGVGALTFALLSVQRAVRGPIPLRPIETRATVPPVYRWLAHTPPAPLVEIPFQEFGFVPTDLGTEALRLYRSVYHWHPLLNGYSGYTPPSHPLVSALVRELPDARAVTLLARTTGLRRIVVHRAELSMAERGRWQSWPPVLHVAAAFGPDLVLDLVDPPPADLMPALRDADGLPVRTMLGIPLAPIPAAVRRADVALVGSPPSTVLKDVPFAIELAVTNRSPSPWPVLALGDVHVVQLAYRWADGRGVVLAADDRAGRLPWDVGSGERVRAMMRVVPPRDVDEARLVVGVAQDGLWFGTGTTVAPIHFAPLPGTS